VNEEGTKAKITTFNERMVYNKENAGIKCVFQIKQSFSASKHKISPVHQWGLYYGEALLVVLSLFVCERGVG